MFAIEKYTVEADACGVSREMIRAQGNYRELGSGLYGTVYGCKDRDVVYKIGEVGTNDGYLAYISAMSELKQHNPFLPKIYGVRFIKDKRGREYFVVAMERLTALRAHEYDCAEFLKEMTIYGSDTVVGSAAKKIGIKVNVPKELVQAIKVVRRAKELAGRSVYWDMHYGNFMMRGKQIVITDPLA